MSNDNKLKVESSGITDINKKILFIVNPISGSGLGKTLGEKLKAIYQYRTISYDIVYSEYAGHACEIAERAKNNGEYTHIVAAGGDGTVNEVASTLLGTDIIFGIVSLGSGNGFARHLGYSANNIEALHQILTDKDEYIDVLEINGKYSFNVSGIGFDAAVAHEFARGSSRGLTNYVDAILKLFFFYKERKYRITYDGKTIEKSAFILSIANTSQYGNNAVIAPLASVKDGYMDICILKKPNIFSYGKLLYYLVSHRLNTLSFYDEIQCKEAVIEGAINETHIDGEPYFMTSPINVKVHHKILRVLVPKYQSKYSKLSDYKNAFANFEALFNINVPTFGKD